MKNQLTKNFRSLVLLCLFCFGCAAAGFAQTSIVGGQKDSVLIDGNPALKQSHVEKLQDFFEWLFAARFAVAERDEFQKLIIRKWQSSGTESS
ncbi:MAG TPA: hypothetical protein VK308_11535, partial [Pyrinomonadaceae bacterium]|nr:hypothetical protein [Pyrinomonadaceae bacterium]